MPQWAPHIGSEDNASDVRSVRRPGWTPKFSQLIQERRAVRSLVFQLARSALISPRRHFSTQVSGSQSVWSTSRRSDMQAMARRRVSILLRRFSYGNVGTWTRNSSNAELILLQSARQKERGKERKKCTLVECCRECRAQLSVQWRRPFSVPSWCGPLDAFPFPHICLLSLNFVTGRSRCTIAATRGPSCRARAWTTSPSTPTADATSRRWTIAHHGCGIIRIKRHQIIGACR